jgi:hypothetical protein
MREGIETFVASYDRLLADLDGKRRVLAGPVGAAGREG